MAAEPTTWTVALIGNPNTGKSTLFSALVGIHQHVGNYPGVTVEKKVGHMEHAGCCYDVIDLPGLYSLAPLAQRDCGRRCPAARQGRGGVQLAGRQRTGRCCHLSRRRREPAPQFLPAEPGVGTRLAHRGGRQHARRGSPPRRPRGLVATRKTSGDASGWNSSQSLDRAGRVENSLGRNDSPWNACLGIVFPRAV